MDEQADQSIVETCDPRNGNLTIKQEYFGYSNLHETASNINDRENVENRHTLEVMPKGEDDVRLYPTTHYLNATKSTLPINSRRRSPEGDCQCYDELEPMISFLEEKDPDYVPRTELQDLALYQLLTETPLTPKREKSTNVSPRVTIINSSRSAGRRTLRNVIHHDLK